MACLETLVANAEKLGASLNDETTNAVISDCESMCERAIELLDDFTVRLNAFPAKFVKTSPDISIKLCAVVA